MIEDDDNYMMGESGMPSERSKGGRNKKVKEHSFQKIRRMCLEAEEDSKALHAEQRSNVLLVSGDHYTKKEAALWGAIRSRRDLTDEQKIRLTDNYTQKIAKTYEQGILSLAPWVQPVPANEEEMQDKKGAELCKAVLEDAKYRYDLTSEIRGWVEDFFRIGEVAVKIVWNPNIGRHIGWKQKLDETGQPVFKTDKKGQKILDQMGQPIPESSEEAVMSGDFEFKRIYGFNLVMPAGSQNIKNVPWIEELDMVPVETVKSWVKNDQDKLSRITESVSEGTGANLYTFNTNNFKYGLRKGYVQVKTVYFRPCQRYPKGYYYMFTDDVMLFKGELPFGLFPIVFKGADNIQSTCRCRSPIKIMRQFQIEINRAASKIAEHQITLGDDKVYMQSGTKFSEGDHKPGVRVYQVTGREPTVLPGRTGDQYLPYLQYKVEAMFNAMGLQLVESDIVDSKSKDGAFGALYKSLRQKNKFLPYASKFEQFLIELGSLYLSFAKNYLDDDTVIRAVGTNEAVNIGEFKNVDDLSYVIKVVPVSDDLETLFGKQLTMNHALQYLGGNLPPEEIGRFLRNMPFANMKDNFKSLTLKHDSAENMMLAMERGEPVQPSKYDDSIFMINALVARTREASFKLLNPQIQQMYQQMIQAYQQIEEENAAKSLEKNKDFIPVDSHNVKVDMYVPKKGAKTPGTMERAKFPQSSLLWLEKRLQEQGYTKEVIDQLPKQVGAEISGNIMPPPPQQGMPPQGMPQMAPQGDPSQMYIPR